jgi:Phage portal protein
VAADTGQFSEDSEAVGGWEQSFNMSGKLSNWLSAPAKSTRGPANYASTPPPFDIHRMAGLRAALGSRALGTPTQDYYALASHYTGLVYLAVNLISNLVSNAKVSFWERNDIDPDGAVKLRRDDPICQLYDNPNPIDTVNDFWFQQVMQKELTGCCLVWAPPDRDPNRFDDAEIAEQWVIPRAGMQLFPPGDPNYPQGYWSYVPNGMFSNYQNGFFTAGTKIPAEQVMVWKSHNPLYRWEGYSALSAMMMSLNTVEAMEMAQLAVQQTGCEQSVAIEFDKDVKPDEPMMDRIRSEWYRRNSGPENAGKLIFTGGGAKINKFATAPAEMGWYDGFAQKAEYLLSSFGTPKALVGMVEELTHSTLFGTLKSHDLTTLSPMLNNLSARHTKDIIAPYYSSSVYMKLEASAIHDDELIEKQLSNDLRCGARTIGEIRRLRGLDTTGEPWENERAYASGPKVDVDLDDAEREQDQDAEAGRPDNIAGEGSLGSKLGQTNKSAARTEAFRASEERAKTLGLLGHHERNGKHTLKMS